MSRLATPVLMLGLLLACGCEATRADAPATAATSASGAPAAPGPAPAGPIPSVSDGDRGVLAVFGSPGTGPAEFSYPRSVGVDAQGRFFVVDRRAWVRRFDAQGRPEAAWQMPEHANGNPRMVRATRAGEVLLADTHYYRVAFFSLDGTEKRAFGERGAEDGKFLFITGAVEDPATGDILTVDYGDDVGRVQRFSAAGEPKASAGGLPGEEPGRFARPMSVAVGPRGRVYVADSCNHRIQVLSADLSSVEAVWEGFKYPYDVDVAPDGRVLVAEYGGNCVTLLDPEGNVTWRHGKPGRGPDELATPWGAAFTDGGRRAVVTDSGNHRLVVLALP